MLAQRDKSLLKDIDLKHGMYFNCDGNLLLSGITTHKPKRGAFLAPMEYVLLLIWAVCTHNDRCLLISQEVFLASFFCNNPHNPAISPFVKTNH